MLTLLFILLSPVFVPSPVFAGDAGESDSEGGASEGTGGEGPGGATGGFSGWSGWGNGGEGAPGENNEESGSRGGRGMASQAEEEDAAFRGYSDAPGGPGGSFGTGAGVHDEDFGFGPGGGRAGFWSGVFGFFGINLANPQDPLGLREDTPAARAKTIGAIFGTPAGLLSLVAEKMMAPKTETEARADRLQNAENLRADIEAGKRNTKSLTANEVYDLAELQTEERQDRLSDLIGRMDEPEEEEEEDPSVRMTPSEYLGNTTASNEGPTTDASVGGRTGSGANQGGVSQGGGGVGPSSQNESTFSDGDPYTSIADTGVADSATQESIALAGSLCAFSFNKLSIERGEEVTGEWMCGAEGRTSGIGFQSGGGQTGRVTGTPNETVTLGIMCADRCLSTATVRVDHPFLEITATPDIVHEGESTTLSWKGTYVATCVVTGPNGFTQNGIEGSAATPPIEFESVYTLACTTRRGNTGSEQVTVRLVPSFENL